MSTPFQSWLAIEKPDPTLETILKGINRFASVDLTERPRISLGVVGGAIVVRAADPGVFFRRIFAERPGSVSALSLAPYRVLRQFHNKILQHEGGRYLIRCAKPSDSPYYRRFLEFQYHQTGVQPDTEDVETRVEKIDLRFVASDSLLWMDPQLLDLDEGEVRNLFDFTATNAPLCANVSGAIFLPPVRSRGHRDLIPAIRAELSVDVDAGSYFSPDLAAIRQELVKQVSDSPSTQEPAAVTVSRAVNDPLLRDILLDGGAIRVLSAEGQPTAVALGVCSGWAPGSRYRERSVLDVEGFDKPEWGRAVLRAIRDDILDLVDYGWTIEPLVPSALSPEWRLRRPRTYNAGGYNGTWIHVQAVGEGLGLRNELHGTFDHRILQPTRERAGEEESPPDNDLAELTFLHDLWRCPWSDNIGEPAWRQAMLELLRDEFRPLFSTAEARVDSWNLAGTERGESDAFNFVHSRRASGGNLLLRYSGSPNDACVLKWRLLLPLGTIVNARTLFLDKAERSHLDSGFVLA